MDAVVCGTFASCIAEIGFVHLGGGGVAQIYDPRGRESVVYDFFCRIPGLQRQPRLEHFSKQVPSPWVPEPGCPASTTHLSVIDEDGMAVSLTHSAGESAGFVVPGTGFIPNNVMGEADLHPEGFHSSPPGHSIATMMTPVIMLKDNRVQAVLGSGGSTRIRTVILQLISNLIDFGFSLKHAVEQPRVHYQDGILQCEKGYSEDARSVLEKIGYQVNFWDSQSIYFGGAHCAEMRSEGSTAGAGDPRRGGATSTGEPMSTGQV